MPGVCVWSLWVCVCPSGRVLGVTVIWHMQSRTVIISVLSRWSGRRLGRKVSPHFISASKTILIYGYTQYIEHLHRLGVSVTEGRNVNLERSGINKCQTAQMEVHVTYKQWHIIAWGKTACPQYIRNHISWKLFSSGMKVEGLTSTPFRISKPYHATTHWDDELVLSWYIMCVGLNNPAGAQVETQ